MEKNVMTMQIKPYSLTELALLYEVKPRTIKIWLKPFLPFIGEKEGRFYTTKQVAVIFDKIGEPPRSTI